MIIGAGAVEFIICHAEVSIAFVEEMKIPEVYYDLPSFLISSRNCYFALSEHSDRGIQN